MNTDLIMKMISSYLINRTFLSYSDFDRLFKFTKIIFVVFAVILATKLGVARLFLKECDPTNAIDMRRVAHYINEDWQKQFGDEKHLKPFGQAFARSLRDRRSLRYRLQKARERDTRSLAENT